jgi:hypothetical protein
MRTFRAEPAALGRRPTAEGDRRDTELTMIRRKPF